MPNEGNTSKIIEWVLRIAVAGEFTGHGMIALLNLNPKWPTWIQKFVSVDTHTAVQLLFIIGLIDLIAAFTVLVKPIRIVLLWMVFWGFWTALVRPFVGEMAWDFIERWANWGAPLALLLLRGWPRSVKEWLE